MTIRPRLSLENTGLKSRENNREGKRMTEKKLPVRTLLLWQIRVTVLFVLLGAVCLYFCSVYKWFWVLVTVITAVFLFVILWYLPRFIRNYRIKLIGEAVIIENEFL